MTLNLKPCGNMHQKRSESNKLLLLVVNGFIPSTLYCILMVPQTINVQQMT